MKAVLLIIGIIMLVVSGVFYALPAPGASAATTTTINGTTTTRTASAALSVPWPITLGLFIIGLVLAVFGLLMPASPAPYVHETTREKSTYHTDSSEVVDDDTGAKRRVTHTRQTRRSE